MFCHTVGGKLSRRALLGSAGRLAALGMAVASGVVPLSSAFANVGRIQPEETIANAMKRLFGDRTPADGAQYIDLKVPMIAENGAVVQTRVEAKMAELGGKQVKSIYILVDNNRRPMAAKYDFQPEAGGALVGTNLRLGGTSPIRAVVELTDGSLYQVAREVRVTVGGCGG